MNTNDGRIMNMDSSAFNELPSEVRSQFVPVMRDLTAKELADNQIRLYSPCGCGSGKKFKFCCHKKP